MGPLWEKTLQGARALRRPGSDAAHAARPIAPLPRQVLPVSVQTPGWLVEPRYLVEM